jgi:hypothetical protein
MSGLSGDDCTGGGARAPLLPFAAALVPLWLSSACKPSNVELYVLNSVYLDGNGAELATRGDVGVFSLVVTDGDLAVVVGVDEVVGVCSAFGCVIGELKSNDKRDLHGEEEENGV